MKTPQIKMSRPKTLRAGAIALALSAFLLPACTTPEPEATTSPAETPVSTEDVAEDTEELIGQTVSVRGEVGEVIDDFSFTLTDEDFFGGDEVLVVDATGKKLPIPTDGMEVQVTGEVRQYKAFNFKEDYDLDWEAAEDYDEKPTIVAKAIALAPDPGEVVENPAEFYNKTIAVEGEVEEVLAPGVFKLDEDELGATNDLMVIHLTPEGEVKDGERVVVTGEVKPFILSEFEKDYDLTWDLEVKEKIEAEYKEKPVMVAAEVYPSVKEE